MPSSWPEIVIIDSMSVRVLSGPRKGKGFHVIAAVGRDQSPGRWSAPLQVVRVATSPTKDADAFEGFCRGLEGIPRVVVTDMASGTRLGISRAFTAADGSLPEMRMGEWHLKRALRGNLPDELLADPHNRVTQQLASAFISPRKWRDFVAAVRFEHKGPYGPLPGALDFIDRNDEQIRAQAATRSPAVPNPTSPVEAVLSELKVRLKDRAGVFTNRIRMNRLLSLMAIELNGQANGRIWADFVRRRTYTIGGRPPRQRQADDPKKTSSLTP